MTPDAAKDASLATQSEMDLSTIQDLSVGETPVQEASERPAFQMVPGPADGALSCGDPKESLPSIVVEPTDLSAQESGEYCWPPKGTASLEEEDIFQEQQTSPSHLTDWQGEGEEQEGAGNEEGSPNKGGVQRRQSNPLATAQLSCSRLTPPPVSQCPEKMPPCLRS